MFTSLLSDFSELIMESPALVVILGVIAALIVANAVVLIVISVKAHKLNAAEKAAQEAPVQPVAAAPACGAADPATEAPAEAPACGTADPVEEVKEEE